MKALSLKTIGGMAITLVMLATLIPAPRAASQQAGGGRLEGTWNVQLTVRVCSTGAVIRTFPEVATFMFGGTMIGSTAGRAQSLKTPGQGVWNHIRGDEYQFSFKHFNFDSAGNFVGWTLVTQHATLYSGATEYTSEGTAQNYDVNGNLLSSGCSTTTATRLQ